MHFLQIERRGGLNLGRQKKFHGVVHSLTFFVILWFEYKSLFHLLRFDHLSIMFLILAVAAFLYPSCLLTEAHVALRQHRG